MGSRIFYAIIGILILLIIGRFLLGLGQRLPAPFGGFFGGVESAAGLDQ